MAETYDPELDALLKAYRQARVKRDYNQVWQGVGAYADARRTGMPGIEALKSRELPKDYYTLSEKTAMKMPILEQKEKATREWSMAGAAQAIKMFEAQSANSRAILDNMTESRRITAQSSADRGRELNDRAEFLRKQHLDESERMMVLDPKQREAFQRGMAPGASARKQLSDRAEAEVLAKHQAVEQNGVFVRADGTEIAREQLKDDIRKTYEALAERVVTGDYAGDPDLQAIAAANGKEKLGYLRDVLADLPGALPGERSKYVEAFIAATGLPAEEVLGSLPDDLRTVVMRDSQMREGRMAENYAGFKKADVAAETGINRIGASTEDVDTAAAELGGLQMAGAPAPLPQESAPVEAQGAAPSPETVGAPTPEGGINPEAIGAPGSSTGTPSPEGVGVSAQGGQAAPAQQQDPQVAAQEALTDTPTARWWRSMGFNSPPPGSGIEVLEGMLTQIDNLPGLPAVELAKQNIINSPQYKAWKEKHGVVTDSDVVFRAFSRDTRARLNEYKQKDAAQVHDAAASGAIKGMALPAVLRSPIKAADRYKARLPQPKPPEVGIPDPQEPQEQPPAPAPVR